MATAMVTSDLEAPSQLTRLAGPHRVIFAVVQGPLRMGRLKVLHGYNAGLCWGNTDLHEHAPSRTEHATAAGSAYAARTA